MTLVLKHTKFIFDWLIPLNIHCEIKLYVYGIGTKINVIAKACKYSSYETGDESMLEGGVRGWDFRVVRFRDGG